MLMLAQNISATTEKFLQYMFWGGGDSMVQQRKKLETKSWVMR